MSRDFQTRLRFVSFFFFVMAIAIAVRTTYLQSGLFTAFNPPQDADEMVLVQPARGEIFDRYGNMLAGNEPAYEIQVDLNAVSLYGNAATLASALSDILDLDYQDVYAKTSAAPGTEGVGFYPTIYNFATETQKQQIENAIDEYSKRVLNDKKLDNSDTLAGIGFKTQSRRIYPEGSLASNVIGFQSIWGDTFFGIEKDYDKMLTGTPIYVQAADANHIFEADYAVPSGADLTLTIDRDIQSSMEKVLDDAMQSTSAETGVIIVMDPKTGEILAMATAPRADLNDFYDFKNSAFNPAIDRLYEPGSVYKVLTMASALDAGVVQEETPFLDVGFYELGGQTFYDWNDGGAWGPQTMTTCMEHSLNACLVWVAEQLGPTNFYAYTKAFWIGRSTNIDLAGEVTWPVKTPEDEGWETKLMGANSFGQSVMVTPIQMVMAVSALANDGKMVAPHVVKSFTYNGITQETDVTVVNTPISKEAAHTITDMLTTSMSGETYEAADIPGYSIAGKTGTAQIPEGGEFSKYTNTSFVGWGPSDDPQFLIYIWLEKPKNDIWASMVVSPIFKKAVINLTDLMNIPPDDLRHELIAKK